MQSLRLMFKKARVKFLEWRYSLHIRARYLHDTTYEKGGWYKNWTDKPYSSSIHKATFVAFIVSYVIFSGMQQLFPYFFSLKPRQAIAGSTNVVWTTQADFTNNNGQTGDTTKSGIDLTTSSGDIKLDSSVGSGANLHLLWDGGTPPSGWTVVSESGGPFYGKFIRGADTYGGTGGFSGHQHTSTGGSTGGSNWNSNISYYGAAGSTGETASAAHTHDPTGIFSNNVEILPPYRNLKVIKYSGGIPSTLPAGVIALFENVPSGWTQYSAQNGYFIRGEATAGGTGGNSTHTHNVTSNDFGLTLSNIRSGVTGGTWSDDHNHPGINLTTNVVDNAPPYRNIILAKADNDNTPYTSGLIGIFDNTPTPGIWDTISDAGGDPFYQTFLRADSTYGATGGSSSHSHTISGETAAPSYDPKFSPSSQNSCSLSCSKARGGHTHTFTGSTSSDSALPPYINVVIAKKASNYASPGTIGGSGGSDVGLRADAGTGAKVKWSNLAFSSAALASGQAIKFAIRTSDNGSTWSNLKGRDGNDISWASNYYGQAFADGSPYTAIHSSTAATRYAEIMVRLESDGSNTPTLNDVTLTYNSISAPTSPKQYRTDTAAEITQGGWSNLSDANFKANVVDAIDNPSTLTPQIEMNTTGTFTGTPGTPGGVTYTPSNINYTGSPITAADLGSVSGLSGGNHYYWKVRYTDGSGRVSGWSAANDFSVETTPPTGTVTINSGAQYTTSTSVNLTLSASDTGGSGLTDMRFSNNGSTWSNWEAYNTSKAGWDLTAYGGNGNDGEKTVYSQFRDGAGNVNVGDITDTITLDTAPPSNVSPDGYEDSGKTNQLTSGNWYSYYQASTKPYFEWSAATDSSGIEGYCVYFGTNASADPASGCTPQVGLTYTLSSPPTEGTNYLRIKAKDNAGNFSDTVGQFIYGYDNTVPSNVAGLTAPTNESTVSSITVHWNQATDSGSGVAGYVLERKRNDAGDWSGPTYASFDISGASTISKVDTGLDGGFKYNYRIKAKDNAGLLSAGFATVDGYTIDNLDPTNPSNVSAVACDGTAPNCSNIANKGYEIKLTWTGSSDSGVGVTGYKIYRRAENNSTNESDFTLVGYIDVDPPGSPASTEYYDNDTNNDATFSDATKGTIKAASTARLNDYVNYHYRITAIDESNNETDVITKDPLNPLIVTNENYSAARTPDVTAPSVPINVVATPMGLDSSGLAQRIDISWDASADSRTVGRTPTGSGSGIAGYKVLQCEGNSTTCSNDGNYSQIGTTASISFTKEGLNEFTEYYYKIIAVDKASSSNISDVNNNNSARSAADGTTTASNTVPTVPLDVTAATKTGNPNSDSDVGHQNTITFKGSYAKNCSGGVRCIIGYELYRAMSNWSGAIKIADISIDPIQDERTVTYTYIDNNSTNNSTSPSITRSEGSVPAVTKSQTPTLLDAKSYYYKVKAKDNTPANPDGGPFQSGLSSIATGTLHAGWDTTPDATKPTTPQDVKVKDIHGDGTSMVRNIITWLRLDDTDAQNQRNGTLDFKEYRVYRYTQPDKSDLSLISTKIDLGDNYHVDGIAMAQANNTFYYYVVAVDNADTEFKYANDTVINSYANISDYLSPVSINPAEAKPTVSGVQAINIGVSSATIIWTTNQSTDSLVEYRIKDSSDVIAAGKNRTTPTTNHNVELKALEKGRTYQYRIVSRNSLGNYDETAATTWNEFNTLDFSITNISISTTTTTATVRWNTNIASDSAVEYKQENSALASKTAGDPNLTTSHEVVIKALKPATTYTYKIRSVTADKYIADTAFATFATKPADTSQFVIAPDASNIAEQNITATSARIVWHTAIPTTTWVDYGTSSGSYNQSSGNDNFNTVHVIELLNLTPGTTYYYRVRGKDTNDIEYTSHEYSFTAVLKPQVSNVNVKDVTPYSVTITWETNVSTDTAVDFGKDETYGQRKGKSETAKSHEIKLDNLEDNTTYHYRIIVRDQFRNEAKTEDKSFATPLDTEGPKINEVKIDLLPLGSDDEYAQAIISWTTNKPSTTKIEYDEGIISGKYGKSSIEDASLNNSHTVIVKDLNPSSTYHFRIVSRDKRDNETKSQDYTFVTPAKEKSILQLILKSLEETFSWVKNVGQFFRNLGKKAK